MIAAHDPGRGTPILLWSPRAAAAPPWLSAEAAARLHVDRHREVYKISQEALAGLQLRFVHDTGRGGIIVVLRQTVAGVEVFHGDVKVLLDRSHRLIGISGAPHPAAHAGAVRSLVGSDASAVAAAMRDRHGIVDVGPRLSPVEGRAGWSRYELSAGEGPRMEAPARVRPVYYPSGDALVPGRLVELQTRDDEGLAVFQYVIADDGRVLYRHDATASDAYTYRVWADSDGDHRPADGPMIDFTPHPTSWPGDGPPGVAESVLVTTEGFHSAGDPWLPPGATETRGNNVDAYVDHTDPGGLQVQDGEFRGAVSEPGVFDWSYDVGLEPLAAESQSMAALTQLFYVTNWMHDWWYDSGFNEAAGNAQADNFGRGGADGDVLLAEGQDAALEGARNNANMSTPMDGASPRMQMYLWTGLDTGATLELDPPGQKFDGGLAKFGPANYDATGPLVRFEDGEGVSPSDGCEAPIVDLKDAIALVDRGNCTFETKVTLAGAAGALGVVIIDNLDADEPIQPGNDNELEDPPVPTMAVTMSDGAALLTALEQGEQAAHMTGWSSVERDGTIDNMIIAHEWGHYLHHRLVECGSQSCGAQSEGWGDFNALMMALRKGDDLDGVFAGTTYANFDPAGYYGIRRVPYSTNTRRNALTFRHIADGEPLPTHHPIAANGIANSEVHNAGEVWATMMWEAYIALHRTHAGKRTFEEVRRRMGDYVVAGMIMAPPAPTYTEQRDSLLMAIAADSAKDFVAVAEAFARRGAGSCAVSPPRDSTTLMGVVEDFEVGPSGLLLAASLAVQDSCDADDVLDPGETGRIRVDVYNGGVLPLQAGAVVEVVDPDPGLTFPDGPTVALPTIAALKMQTVSIDVKLADVAAHRPLTLRLRLRGTDVCGETSERTLLTEIAADVAPGSASTDDVEAEPSAWARDGNGGETIWTRTSGATAGFFWHADDVGRTSDTSLVSPLLEVGDTALVVTFDHAHKFEQSDGTNYDGGVVEFTSDDGETWVDIATLTDETGYQGTIAAATNPLDQRPAFVGESESYPGTERAVLDLGTALAGKTIRLRFRVGTDAGAGAPGWDIDNIEIAGITNTPFPTWVDDPGCDAGDGESTPTGDEQGTSDPGDSDSDPHVDGSDGCGCAAETSAGGWQIVPWLLLSRLGRRRRTR